MKNKNNIAVTIITSAYNVREYIEECISSVLNQTLKNFEWIILDNGSDDETREILKKYAQDDNRIILLRNEYNNRIHGNQNEKILHYIDLVMKANGNYITDLDSDDYLSEGYLEKMHDEAIRYDADIVACGTNMFLDADKKQVNHRIPPEIHTKDSSELFDDIEKYYGTFRPSWGKLFKKNFYLSNIKFFLQRPNYMTNGSDTLLCLRALKKANSVVCLNEGLYYYRIRDNSGYNSNIYSDRYKSYDFIYKESLRMLKNWDKLTEKNHTFIISVHYHSMIDCIDIAIQAEKADVRKKIELVEGIINSKILNSYINLIDKSSKTLIAQKIDYLLNKIYYDENIEDKVLLERYFLYRQFKARMMLKSIRNNDSVLLYFSSIFDLNNKYMWGKEHYLEFLKLVLPQEFIQLQNKFNMDIFIRNKKLALAILNNNIEQAKQICEMELSKNKIIKNDFLVINNILTDINKKLEYEVIDKTKNNILEHLNNNNVYLASEYLLKLNKVIPFDRDVIYFRAYISFLIKDIEIAFNLAFSGLSIYPDDFGLTLLAADILYNSRYEEIAIKFYEKAFILSDVETKDYIYDFIEELKNTKIMKNIER